MRQKHVRDTIMPSFRHSCRSRLCRQGGDGRFSALDQLGFCSDADSAGIVMALGTIKGTFRRQDIKTPVGLCVRPRISHVVLILAGVNRSLPVLSASDHWPDLPLTAVVQSSYTVVQLS